MQVDISFYHFLDVTTLFKLQIVFYLQLKTQTGHHQQMSHAPFVPRTARVQNLDGTGIFFQLCSVIVSGTVYPRTVCPDTACPGTLYPVQTQCAWCHNILLRRLVFLSFCTNPWSRISTHRVSALEFRPTIMKLKKSLLYLYIILYLTFVNYTYSD